MTLYLSNTLSRHKEPLIPMTPGKLTLYLCGPTVYDDPHLGHARSAVVFDVIVRYLKVKGYDVRYVRNVTDIDDKIISRARERNQHFRTLADHYLHRFHQALERLNVQPPDAEPRPSEHLSSIHTCISALVNKGHAYISGGNVYFSVPSFKAYGLLSGYRLELPRLSQTRADSENKRHPADFALWKAARPDEPHWQSPWGKGRPGWHIECSAMSSHLLGDVFDIHGGGADLIFPHHENEIAQSTGICGRRPARYWVHNGLVNVNGEKMSKSRGNCPNLFDLLNTYPADAIRLFLLAKRYRHPLEFSTEAMHSAVCQLKRLHRFFDQSLFLRNPQVKRNWTGPSLWEHFYHAMDDDFNFPMALAVVFGAVKLCNRSRTAAVKREKCPGLSNPEAACHDLYHICQNIFGLTLEPIGQHAKDCAYQQIYNH